MVDGKQINWKLEQVRALYKILRTVEDVLDYAVSLLEDVMRTATVEHLGED